MATRTFKAYGFSTSGATLTMDFNGIQVYNGNVSAGGDDSNLVELFEFTADTSISGDTSTSFTISSGDVAVVGLKANYFGVIPARVTIDGVEKDSPFADPVTAAENVTTFQPMDGWSATSTKNWTKNGTSINHELIDGEDGAVANILQSGDTATATFVIDAAQDVD